ncbi:hypothetical protein [Polyangium aurulentum]|uniref:hypothetical protein n=1 Tax=Polyangium aurulentum TaxID=2567896 RepID=UPI00146D06D7|nr:hypothetical protein [Polyangium aurulentum]UQA54586.1 hypothetical protein E8A73_024760 [Polyangium aurulentum]
MQLEIDHDKRFSWPLCVELWRTRYRCEGALVVLTVHPHVRRWISREILPVTGLWGAQRQMRPLVLALDEMDLSLLLRPDRPHLARLAVAAHAAAKDLPEVADEAVRITIERLPDRLATAQLDAILGMVDRALRTTLERRMMEHPRFRSETFRRWYAQATAEGLAEGTAKGLAEGTAKGLAEGTAKGLAEGKANSILTVLAARCIPVSDALRARILKCTDLDTLDTWLRRAVVVSSASAVVRAPSARPKGKPLGSSRKTARAHRP